MFECLKNSPFSSFALVLLSNQEHIHSCVIFRKIRHGQKPELNCGRGHHGPNHKSLWGPSCRWGRWWVWWRCPCWRAGRERWTWGVIAGETCLQDIFFVSKVEVGVFSFWNCFSRFLALENSHNVCAAPQSETSSLIRIYAFQRSTKAKPLLW